MGMGRQNFASNVTFYSCVGYRQNNPGRQQMDEPTTLQGRVQVSGTVQCVAGKC